MEGGLLRTIDSEICDGKLTLIRSQILKMPLMKPIITTLSLLLFSSLINAHEGETHDSAAQQESVLVFKYDQSVQCGKAGIAPARGQQRLENAGIEVKCSFKAHDGMMRPQACGRPSGNINVFEISAAKLAEALDEGFKSVASLSRFSGELCSQTQSLTPVSNEQPKPRPLPVPKKN